MQSEEDEESHGLILQGDASSAGDRDGARGDGGGDGGVWPLNLHCGAHQLVLLRPRLFLKKCAIVVAASAALIPLLAQKAALPGYLYVALLLVIHVGVLVVYLWRVAFCQLDPNWRILGLRILGLVVSMWLLSVVGSPSDEVDLIGVALQMILLCVLHAVVLLFLMVAIEPRKLLDRDRARE